MGFGKDLLCEFDTQLSSRGLHKTGGCYLPQPRGDSFMIMATVRNSIRKTPPLAFSTTPYDRQRLLKNNEDPVLIIVGSLVGF